MSHGNNNDRRPSTFAARRVLSGIPAILFPLLAATSAPAIQSPVVYHMPAPDSATAVQASKAARPVNNYAPPVHVPPPAAGTYVAARLSDCEECEAAATGELIRRPGLQDRITGAVKRFAQSDRDDSNREASHSEPTLAPTPEVNESESYAQAAPPIGILNKARERANQERSNVDLASTSSKDVSSKSRGTARASRSFADQVARVEKARHAYQRNQTERTPSPSVRPDAFEDRLSPTERYARYLESDAAPVERSILLATGGREANESRDHRVTHAVPQRDRFQTRPKVGRPEWVDEEIEPVVLVDPPRQRRSTSYVSNQRSRIPARKISVLTRQEGSSSDSSAGRVRSVTNRLRLVGQSGDSDNDLDLRPDADDDRSDSALEKIDDFEDMDEDLDRDIDQELEDLDELGDEDEDADIDEDDEDISRAPDKSCGEFRNELLSSTIRDIALDISPPASSLPGSYSVGRTWTDRSGNIIATGAMSDLRRGYVILDSGQKIAYARLSEADWAAVSEFWRLPTTCSVGDRGSVHRNWVPQTFTWSASNLCHKPLYFENRQLERYGHSHGPFTQPVQSAAHFFVSFFTLPYQMSINPANECQYALGYYRPGNCAPWLKDPVPLSLDGARRQALFVTGMSFIP